MRSYARLSFDGVTVYARSAGFEVLLAGSKPFKIEKNFNPGADLLSVVPELIRSIMVVTPARRDDNIV